MVARVAIEILGRLLNKVDGNFKTLKDITPEENDHIRKDLKGCQRAEFEMKEATFSMECRLIEDLSMIETMRSETKAPKESVKLEDHCRLTKIGRTRSRLPSYLCSKEPVECKRWRISFAF